MKATSTADTSGILRRHRPPRADRRSRSGAVATSENPLKTKFAELSFHAPVNKGKRKDQGAHTPRPSVTVSGYYLVKLKLATLVVPSSNFTTSWRYWPAHPFSVFHT